MAHQYVSTVVSGGTVIQGNYHNDASVHHHYPTATTTSIKEMKAWLSDLNFAPSLQALCNKRTPETGQWLLDHNRFRAWHSNDSPRDRVLWCRGHPGTGKSILCALVIETLKRSPQPGQPVVYCFFDYAQRDSLTAEKVLANILLQIVSSDPSTCEPMLANLYQECEHGRRPPTMDELALAFQNLCNVIPRTLLVIDALDETEHSVRRRLLSALRLQTNTSCHVMIFARVHVEPQLYTVTSSESMSEIIIRANHEDLKLFLEGRFLDSEDLCLAMDGHEVGTQKIVQQIIEQADSSFLAAEIRFNSVQYALTFSEVEKALCEEVTGLDDLYEDTMKRIHSQAPQRVELASLGLDLVSTCKRPLYTDELLHALGLLMTKGSFAVAASLKIESIISACHGLISRDVRTDRVRLLHYTVLEYLDKRPEKSTTNIVALSACLACLHSVTRKALPRSLMASGNAWTHLRVARTYPFVRYACLFWQTHVADDKESHCRALEFLKSSQQLQIWQEILLFHYPDHHRKMSLGSPFLSEGLEGYGMGIWIAAYMERADLGLELSSSSIQGKYPLLDQMLFNAIELGQLQCLRVLLAIGATTTCLDHRGDSPVHAAVRADSASAIRILAEYGADIHRHNATDKTPLQMGIVLKKDLSCIRELLQHGALGEDDHARSSILLTTIRSGYTDVLMLLLQYTGETIQRGGQGDIIACYTTVSQKPEALQAPVKHGENNNNTALLHLAITFRQADMAYRLLAFGADVNAQDALGQTPLHLAVHSSQILIIRQLLDTYGADINIQNSLGETPLHLAIIARQSRIALLLLELGADVNIRQNLGQTPLDLILGSTNSVGRTMFNGAPFPSLGISEKMLTALLTSQSVNENTDTHAIALLHPSVVNLCIDLTETILKRGVDPDTRVKDNTALHSYFHMLRAGKDSVSIKPQYGLWKLIRLLLSHHADVNAQDSDGNTYLHLFVEFMYALTLQLFTGPLRMARSEAAQIIQLLLDKGANPWLSNNLGWSPGGHAIVRDHKDKGNHISKLLMECITKTSWLSKIVPNDLGPSNELGPQLGPASAFWSFREKSDTEGKAPWLE